MGPGQNLVGVTVWVVAWRREGGGGGVNNQGPLKPCRNKRAGLRYKIPLYFLQIKYKHKLHVGAELCLHEAPERIIFIISPGVGQNTITHRPFKNLNNFN